MASIVKNYASNNGISGATLKLTYTGTNQTVGSNFTLISPTISYAFSGVTQYSVSSWTPHATINVHLTVSIGSQTIGEYIYSGGGSASYKSDTDFLQGTLNLTTTPSNTVDLSKVFSSSNASSIYNYVLITINSISASVTNRDSFSHWYYSNQAYTTAADAIALIYLNAPPTLTYSGVTYDRNYIYKDYTKAKVSITDLSAKYGGSITSCTLKIGNATISKTTNGDYQVTLVNTGTVTPTITVIDSRNQTTVITLPNITIDYYKLPILNSIAAQRVDNNNVAADEGERILITAKFTYDTNVAKLQSPTVTYQQEGASSASTPTITWYSNATLTTAISDWTTISSGATIYGLITSQCSKDYNYLIVCTPRDNVPNSGTSKSTVVPPAYYTIDFKAGGRGIAFGAPAANDAFYCGMVSYFRDNRYLYIDDTDSSTGDDLILKNIFNTLGWSSIIV